MKHKIFTLVLFISVMYVHTFTQPIVRHQRIAGSNIGGSFCTSIWLTNDGGVIMGGASYGRAGGNKSEDNRGDYDFWVVKLNSLGQIQWDKTIGGTGQDVLYAIQQTKDGGYILTGDSESPKSYEKSEDLLKSFFTLPLYFSLIDNRVFLSCYNNFLHCTRCIVF